MQNFQKFTRKRSWLRRLAAIAVMVAAIGGLLSQTVFAQNSYIITDGDQVTVHKSYSSDPEEVLTEAGFHLDEEDTYTTANHDGVNEITIRRMQMVTVTYRGEQSVIGTYGESVSSLLARMGITLEGGDVLCCDSEALTYDGMRVEIVLRETKIEEADQAIPYQTNVFEDPELEPGEELILVPGTDGLVHTKTEVVYENGKEVSRRVLQETVKQQAVTQLVIRGVDRLIMKQPEEPEKTSTPSLESAPAASPSGSSGYSGSSGNSSGSGNGGSAAVGDNVITTASGETYTYVDVLTCSATAYTCEGYTGYTYSGTVARVGAIAVDPNVIPLGTKMYVVSNDGQYVYGYCVAEDIGGGIKGNKIDLYFNTYAECWNFGVRTCTVYILG